MQNIVVDGINVRITKDLMNKSFIKAIISNKGTYSELETAKANLEHGRGIYLCLEHLGLLNEEEVFRSKQDIERIESKIKTTRQEKEAEMYARHMQRKGGNQ